MSQRRVLDFGAPVIAEAINYSNKQRSASGILSPATDIIEVLGPTVIKVNAHTVLTPDGVIITNTTSENLNFTPTLSEKTHTIILRHTYVNSSGGTAASLEMLDTLFPTNYFTDATVLGWVMYPGGSVSLDSTMLFFPRCLRIEESSDDDTPVYTASAPFAAKWLSLSADPGITVTDAYSGNHAYSQIFNSNTIIIQNMVKVLPIVATKYQPSAIRVTCKADFQAGLIVSVFDEYGTEYFPSNNIISNTDWNTFYMKLPNFNGMDVFQPHSTWKLKMRFQLNPNKNFYLESVDVVDHNVPVSPNATVVDFNFPFTFARLSSVLSRWNPITGLPTAPAVGDRYLSTATGNTWNINEIREWDGSVWNATVPVSGNVTTVVGEGSDYVYNGLNWVKNIPKHKINV